MLYYSVLHEVLVYSCRPQFLELCTELMYIYTTSCACILSSTTGCEASCLYLLHVVHDCLSFLHLVILQFEHSAMVTVASVPLHDTLTSVILTTLNCLMKVLQVHGVLQLWIRRRHSGVAQQCP